MSSIADFIDLMIPGEVLYLPNEIKVPVMERAKWLREKYPDEFNFKINSLKNGTFRFARLSPEKKNEDE